MNTFPTVTVFSFVGGTVASWLVGSTPERGVRVRAMTGEIVLCSWERDLNLTVPLSTQVYKWVPASCWGKPNKLWEGDLRWTSIPSREVEILPAASCYRNWDKLWETMSQSGLQGFTSHRKQVPMLFQPFQPGWRLFKKWIHQTNQKSFSLEEYKKAQPTRNG